MKRITRHVKLDSEVDEEVKRIAKGTKLPEIEIVRQLVLAGVEAIRANGYKLPLPLLLEVKEPVDFGAHAARAPGEGPEGGDESSRVEEGGPPPVAPPAKARVSRVSDKGSYRKGTAKLRRAVGGGGFPGVGPWL